MKHTIIIGPQASGKSIRALQLANQSGKHVSIDWMALCVHPFGLAGITDEKAIIIDDMPRKTMLRRTGSKYAENAWNRIVEVARNSEMLIARQCQSPRHIPTPTLIICCTEYPPLHVIASGIFDVIEIRVPKAADTILDVRPLWYVCFLDRVRQLRKTTDRDDITFYWAALTGYTSGLYCTDTIDQNQYQLLDVVAENAKEWALKDAEVA